jgi:diphthamide biosynthesis protein 7
MERTASRSTMAETLATFDTGETADCVEACAVPGLEASMVVATYQLHKDEGGDRRSGTLQHLHLANGESVQVAKTQHLETASGIFDIKWSTQAHSGRALLGAATAAGTLELYELTPATDTDRDTPATLQHSGVATEGDADSMCLSLDWSDRVHATSEPSICVSHSDGCVCSSCMA